ncbi:LPS translocon maturation chaperone LptM [Aquabacterium commune]|uniref:LPS translocon maturation chaperone LptM n=1 Tax=Aquabacterium commune TaxID=70586 RepID=UPI00105E32E5|nr:lipoprotein [Aquabacterium commune]
MIRNPQILGSRAPVRRGTVWVTLCLTLSVAPLLGACGLKGPLYLPGPPTTATSADTSAPAPATAPSTPNTPAR